MATENRLIDANAVIKEIDNYYNNSPFPHPGTSWRRGFEFAAGLVLNAPTVDAVEVVRCKDCKYRKKKVCAMPYAGMWVGVELKDSDFCSYGERRTDNG